MIKYKNYLIILFIFLVSCGYSPILSVKESNFSINNIEFVSANKMNSKIQNELKIYKNSINKSKIYNLIIATDKNKKVSMRDSKGDPKIFVMNMSVDIEVIESGLTKSKRKFSEEFSYNNNENKFDLSRYEENIENNIINKLVERIISYLHSI
mgnify:CR=1 FL=1